MFLKRILSSIITIALCASFILPINTFAAASFTGGTNVSGGLNVAVPITDLQVTGVGSGDTVPVFLYVPAGSLSMTTTTGLTFTGSTSGQRLYFSGTLTDVNAALATLQYTHSSAGTFTLEASIIGAGQIYDPSTQHMYEVVNNGGPITATAARSAATARTINGVIGYLANITSSEENAFVAARITQDGWFGASDAGVEGDWVWLDGPETGLVFWRGVANGTSFGYENWANDEPNQAGNEDCSQFYANGSGWNDLPCSVTLNYYIVEYGAPGNLPNVASDTLNITLSADTTTQAPTLTSPTSNSLQNTLQLIYSLPEVPLAGSVNVVFNNGTATTTYIMGDTQSVNTPIYINSLTSPSNQTWTYSNLLEDYLLLGSWVEGHIGDGTYTVTLSYRDYLGNPANSAVASAVTIDTTSPLMSAINSSILFPPGAAITWTTNEGSTSRVEYGLTDAYGSFTVLDSSFVTSHTVNITGLAQVTTYHYRVISTDAAGNSTTSADNTFTTQNGGGGNSRVSNEQSAKMEQLTTHKPETTEERVIVPDMTEAQKESATVLPPLNSAEEKTSCEIHEYLKNPIRLGAKNNTEDVKLLEQFLNKYENAGLTIDGIYSREDFNAVIKWQEKYADDILKPWGLKKGTGYIYIKSLAKIKEIEESSCEIEEIKK